MAKRRSKSSKGSLVSGKIKVLRREGIPQRQSVAMAINMGREGRLRPGGRYIRKGGSRR